MTGMPLRRVLAALLVPVSLLALAACGPDKPGTDWSKYSAPGPSAVQRGQQPVH